MKNSEKQNEKEKKPTFFKNILQKLREKDEIEVRARLAALVELLLTAAIAYLAGGARIFFGTYPVCIALLCSDRRRLLPISLGLGLLAITGRLPEVYIFTSVAVPLVRILVTYVPIMLEDSKREGQASTALIAYNPHLPEASGRTGGQGAAVKHGSQLNTKKKESVKLFCESIGAKCLSALISGLICGIFLLIRSDFSFYSLYATLTLMLSCPLLTVTFAGLLGEKRQSNRIHSLISVGTISALCVFASHSMSIIGMPMSPFLAMLITLYITSSQGILPGAAIATICGLAFDPIHTPLFIICAILFFLISALKRNAGLAVVCAAIVVWCYYIGGSQGLIGVLPPTLLALPVYMLADKYREMIIAPFDKSAVIAGGVYFAEAVTEKNKNAAVRERLGALSEAFSVLSENFYKLSDRRRRPDALGIKKLCEASFEKHCEGCQRRDMCWGDEYESTLDAIKSAAGALHKKGEVSAGDISGFEERCIRSKRIINHLNSSLSHATESVIKDDKLGFLASSYDDINALLRDALECDTEEYECDKEAQEKLLDALYDEGIRSSGVVVFGKRCRRITVKGMKGVKEINAKRAASIRLSAEKTVGSSLTDPIFESGSDGIVMHMSSRPIYRARYAYGRISASKESVEPVLDKSSLYVDPFADIEDKEEPCGDTANAFITSSSYFYSLISDGMGSGSEAAFISGVCSMFIEKMLSAGNRSDITVRMLNNVLRNENMGSGGECSATVDLCELDLISGTASFLKSGAAPTYIARGGTVYKVYSRTMPIGILKNADTRISKFDTQKGDIIIMMSDGCCPDSEDCPWLVEYLCEYMSRKDKNALGQDAECESLKDSLLSLAVKNFPAEKERDDISVSVIMIE